MNEILTEIWIQAIIIANYVEHAEHVPAILGMFGVLLLVGVSFIINTKRNA
jgi:hypothetical protein